jgi:uncharacterized protein DUF2380
MREVGRFTVIPPALIFHALTMTPALLLTLAAAVAGHSTPPERQPSRVQPATAEVPASSGRPIGRFTTRPERSASISVALFDFAFYGTHANSIEPGDTTMAAVATAALREDLARLPGVVLLDSVALARAASAPGPRDSANGKPCNVVIACARAAARQAGAAWAITGTVSKTSNLIWLFSGQLIDVRTGKLVMDDEYELKGDSREMVVQGARVFAQRVAKKLGLVQAAAAADSSPPSDAAR